MITIDTTLYLQIAGSILAIAGAVCNCSPARCNKYYGFAAWVISNATLLCWSFLVQAWYLCVMYGVFMLTSVYGVLTHRKDHV